MAKEENIFIDQGATFKMQLDLTDSDDAIVDLTGYSARMFIKREISDVTPAVQVTTSNGKAVITALSGAILFTIQDEETDAMAGNYYYDIEIESSGGEVTRLMQGRAIVSDGVTR